MRDFFITSFERLIGVVVVLLILGVLIGGVGAMVAEGGGILQGLAVLLIGGVYVIFVGGAMYLALGIYHNTRRTAEALERGAGR